MVSRLREPRDLHEVEEVGDGPAAVFGDETCNKPLVLRTGKAQGLGRSESQKTCLDILHE